ncbi:MAG: protein kinase [Gordonia sp. (in: high G+C Gram-positive bacteria)]
MTLGDDITAPSAPPTGAVAPGDIIAGYRIERALGQGGMGTVYVAAHPRLPRRDVLKLLNTAYSGDASFRARFEREADLAGSLEHRNIVSVYDRGVEDGHLWIAMRYVRGYDASALIRAQPDGIDPYFAAHIITEIGTGLDHAHRRGMVHRDVKPANILIETDDDGNTDSVLLTDFGIARAVDDAQHLTDTGLTVASVPYASPEQLYGSRLDGRADQYSLACTLVELLTGQPPFPRDSRVATMTAHLQDAPPAVSECNPALPPALDPVIQRALSKEADGRYRTCVEFAHAVVAALRQSPPPPAPYSGALAAQPTAAFPERPAVADPGARRRPPPHQQHGWSPARGPAGERTPTAKMTETPGAAIPSGQTFVPPNAADRTHLIDETGPPPHAPGSRTTTALISLAIILVLVAAIAAVLAYLNRSEDTGKWTSAGDAITAAFPHLLPAGPKVDGFGGATCQEVTADGIPAIECAISSGDRRGLTYTVWHTTTDAARTAVTNALGNQPGTPVEWSQGPVRVSADDVSDGWVVTTFTDAARRGFTVIATWPAHTGQQVLDGWWRGAPFEAS